MWECIKVSWDGMEADGGILQGEPLSTAVSPSYHTEIIKLWYTARLGLTKILELSLITLLKKITIKIRILVNHLDIQNFLLNEIFRWNFRLDLEVTRNWSKIWWRCYTNVIDSPSIVGKQIWGLLFLALNNHLLSLIKVWLNDSFIVIWFVSLGIFSCLDYKNPDLGETPGF